MKHSERFAYYDNAKFLLMILVVFSHLLQPFIGDKKVYHDLYYFIFTFHMPAFVFIAGYFAKPAASWSQIMKLVKKLLLPYVFFQFFYSCYYWLIGLDKEFSFQLFHPEWSLWFLVSLFCWQLSLVFFQKISKKSAVIISILFSLAAGYFPFLDQMLTLQRTFVFLPFFIIGYVLPKDGMKFFQQPFLHKISKYFLLVGYLFIALFHGMNKYMVFGSKPYEDYLSYPLFGGILRAVFLIVGLGGIIGFLRFVPKETMFFTKWGKGTLLVYLLQGIVIKGLRALSVSELDLSLLGLVSLFLFSIGLTCFFASQPLQKIYGRFEAALSKIIVAVTPFFFL